MISNENTNQKHQATSSQIRRGRPSQSSEEQLSSLSPSFFENGRYKKRRSTSSSDNIRVQTETLQQTFDDLDKEVSKKKDEESERPQQPLQGGNDHPKHNRRNDAPVLNNIDCLLYAPVQECPLIGKDCYMPLPSLTRHYLPAPTGPAADVKPYPFRKRQPVSWRLQRETNTAVSGEPVHRSDHAATERVSHLYSKRHSLASGQIDRLVHAYREADGPADVARFRTSEFWKATTSPLANPAPVEDAVHPFDKRELKK